MNSYDTTHNSATTSRKDVTTSGGNLFTQQQQLPPRLGKQSRNGGFNSNNTVNFLGLAAAGSLGTLGAQSNPSDVDSDQTPIPSFGRISARGDDKGGTNRTSEQNKQINKALTFSESSKNKLTIIRFTFV
jgi:hypothetical protein